MDHDSNLRNHSWMARIMPLAASFTMLVAIVTAVAAEPGQAKNATPALDAKSAPMAVVQAYVDAANRNDLEGFLALYAPGIAKYRFPATPASQGIAHMREVYSRSFARKQGLHVEVISMVSLGDKVVSRDHVTGLPDGQSADELTIYQVENGLITNIVYVDKEEHAAAAAKHE
ncbi:hypothetical protein BCF11_5347 [Collimonas sp. PA-H2]|uniref:nuclear transport factor 2 family protein n=1 Tax=Collimonas sp. PA-H2 TaxID=1881062 RepID=UPI000BF52A58|nr:nuclear transport factor 2 family protein [Collimonas sp. PA-H2]PFH04563.1 hypothetical protein BCF11_5347 [Collimonas sp. PA-H2]